MEVWRLSDARWADAVLSGEGASRFGGRWNPPGTAAVYCAEALSLAALELFVRLARGAAGRELRAFRIRLPDESDRTEVGADALPPGWRDLRTFDACRALGRAWMDEGRTLALAVPSVLIPEERNVVLNPRHPDFARVAIAGSRPFSFDPRMWK